MNMRKIIHRDKDLRRGRELEKLAGAVETLHKLSLSRRQALKGGAAAVLALLMGGAASALMSGAKRAMADEAVKTGKFVIPRLEFSVTDETGDIWNTGPIGDANLRAKLKELTNINVSDEARIVRLADIDDLCRNPYVFMTSMGHFNLGDKQEKNLREFLERGGFVHSDDCIYPTAKHHDTPSDIVGNVVKPRTGSDYCGPNDVDRFWRDYVLMINRLFPDNPMRRIPEDHELFKVYYEFKDGCPHMQGVKHGAWGLFEPGTGRIMTIASPGDLHCGWMDQYWSKEKNLEAIKMGINIIIYYLSH